MRNAWKAADVPDGLFLAVVRASQARRNEEFLASVAEHRGFDYRSYYTEDSPVPTTRWDIEEMLPVPDKVLLAKAKRMIKRGLMDGCTCGCRGEYELTAAGREAAGAP